MKIDTFSIERKFHNYIDSIVEETIEATLKVKGIYIKPNEEILFPHRSKVVKSIYASLDNIKDYMHQKYPREIKFSGKIYPKKWMVDDHQILETMERYPLLVPILNFIFDYTRYKKGDDYREMVAICDSVSKRTKYTRKLNRGVSRRYDYASFVADRFFYDAITKKLGRSEILIKKYIQALKEANIIVEVGIYKRQRVYSDAYYVPMKGGKVRKIGFFRKTPAFRKSLRNFVLKR